MKFNKSGEKIARESRCNATIYSPFHCENIHGVRYEKYPSPHISMRTSKLDHYFLKSTVLNDICTIFKTRYLSAKRIIHLSIFDPNLEALCLVDSPGEQFLARKVKQVQLKSPKRSYKHETNNSILSRTCSTLDTVKFSLIFDYIIQNYNATCNSLH